MSNYVKLATDAGDQYLATLAEMQENFLKASAAFSTRLSATMATMPAVETPAFATMMPSAQEVTEAGFSFAQKFLKQQKSFAEKMLATSVVPAK